MLKHKIFAHYVVLDLAEPDPDLKLLEEVKKHDLEVDWLINNAGFGSVGDFAKLDIDRELQMIELNISALVTITHAFLQGMRERKRGTVINVSSAAGFQPIPFMATYAATKAFVSSFTEAIAEENKPYGIQIMALCPGSTKTNFFAASNIDRPIQVKGQQTVEDVVETAMRAVASGRTKVVSGVVNKIGAMLGKFTPNFISRRAMAAILRPRLEEKK